MARTGILRRGLGEETVVHAVNVGPVCNYLKVGISGNGPSQRTGSDSHQGYLNLPPACITWHVSSLLCRRKLDKLSAAAADTACLQGYKVCIDNVDNTGRYYVQIYVTAKISKVGVYSCRWVA